MKKLAAFSLIVTAAALLNAGCTASASVHKADATRPDPSRQIAYVAAPTK